MNSDRSFQTERQRRLRGIGVVILWMVVVFATVILIGEATIGPRADSSISQLLLGRSTSAN